MSYLTVRTENIKRLTAVEIKPDGSVVQVTGKNGSGKSSVLDAIYITRLQAARRCRRNKLDLGEIKVTRKFTGESTTLTVESAAGARYSSPQKMLDELVGAISFDPLEFSRLEPKQQFDQLRRISKVECDLDVIAGKNAKDFDDRTDINKRAKSLRAQADGIPTPTALPDVPVDVDALLTKLTEASAHNTKVQKAHDDVTRTHMDGQRLDVQELRKSIDAARNTNTAIAQRERKNALMAEAEDEEAKATALTESIKARNKVRDDALAAAKMPIDGISLGDGVVLFEGLPFDQASSAAQLRASTAIAMAANPQIKVLLIKDGGLLDDDGMRMLREMADAGDYQVWIEAVHASGPVSVEMVDGAVKRATVDGALGTAEEKLL